MESVDIHTNTNGRNGKFIEVRDYREEIKSIQCLVSIEPPNELFIARIVGRRFINTNNITIDNVHHVPEEQYQRLLETLDLYEFFNISMPSKIEGMDIDSYVDFLLE